MLRVALAFTLAAGPALATGLQVEVAGEGANGTVTIDLLEEVAPNHVAQIVALAEAGAYDGVVFHRVIDGFMAQTGDPTGTGGGGSDYPDLMAEFSGEPFVRGTLGMARTNNPNSANSQFFITFADAPWLNGQYTVFGRVIEGMEHVDAIERGEPPANPGKIIKASVIEA